MFITIMPQNLKSILKKVCYLSFVMALFFTSCQKENTVPLTEQNQSTVIDAETAAHNALQMAKEHRLVSIFDTNGIKRMYPNINETKARKAAEDIINKLGGSYGYEYYEAIFEHTINPEDFECGSPTFLDEFVIASIEGFTEAQLNLLLGNNVAVFLEAQFFDNTPADEDFGINGEYNNSLRRNFIKLKRFWNIPTDIILVDLKGTIFKDEASISELVQTFFIVGFDEDGNPIFADKEFADQYANFLKIGFSHPIFQDYNHPLFSFNAFAAPANPFFNAPKKVAMGDGLMEAYRANGLRTMADNFILAHEYGHQIQFANEYIPEGQRTPEETRFIELMADAYAAYYMAHGRGSFLQPAVIVQSVKTAFAIGDCQFSSPGHHGTHNQRAKAAAFGSKLAKRISFIDSRLTSEEFYELFLVEYPTIIKPDAG